MHYLEHPGNGQAMDMSDTITRMCVCGSTWFHTIMSFDEDYEVAAYGLDGECVECGTRVKLPCPLDLNQSP